MFPAGNKAKRISSVTLTTKTIHHHHRHYHLLLSKWCTCCRSKIRKYQILSKLHETPNMGTKWRLKLYSVQCVTSEVSYGVRSKFYKEWRDNSITNSKWILKETNFSMNNVHVVQLVTKEFRHQWLLQHQANNDWKVSPSKIKLLYMIELIHFHVYVSIFAIFAIFSIFAIKKLDLHFPFLYIFKNFSSAYIRPKIWHNFVH